MSSAEMPLHETGGAAFGGSDSRFELLNQFEGGLAIRNIFECAGCPEMGKPTRAVWARGVHSSGMARSIEHCSDCASVSPNAAADKTRI